MITRELRVMQGSPYEGGSFELRFRVALFSAVQMMKQESRLGHMSLSSVSNAPAALQKSPGQNAGCIGFDSSMESVGAISLEIRGLLKPGRRNSGGRMLRFWRCLDDTNASLYSGSSLYPRRLECISRRLQSKLRRFYPAIIKDLHGFVGSAKANATR